jgi:hypothetical protein
MMNFPTTSYDETWVSIVSVEIKAVDAHTFTTQTNICQRADGNGFLGQQRSTKGQIH